MKKLSKALLWFYMLGKRLLLRRSFVILLCLIPLLIPLLNIAMSQESGILHIILCNEDNDQTAAEIIRKLDGSSELLRFSVYTDKDLARQAVQAHKADAAWIFSSNFDENLRSYAAGKSMRPCIEIIERDTTIPLRISRELLFCSIYKDFSYYIYEGFVYASIVSEDVLPREKAALYYDSLERLDHIVQIEQINAKALPQGETNYLTAPIRGMLSIFVMLCTLASAMFFIADRRRGAFDWLSPEKRIIPAIASCFSAALLSSTVVLISILLSGFSTGFVNEVISAAILVLIAAAFGSLICILFRSAGKLGASVPGMIIIMLALSPIFFNLKILRPIRLMLPTYYYLQSVYNADYYAYSMLYLCIVCILIWLCNTCLARRIDKTTII